ncbi:DUF6932 family protein [Thauera aromatica]|uniref:Polymerase nucleotidyl transferase domain-containing protein n=1 Tax=Thauera aromatica K172 TaxID=44139 RepID=A0A2R4BNW5_THAAR|nr:hypothetical protein [Thauera aromatica]AVR89037.1 hypothetical protein Tharo_2134 [Thauera aromatica K172]
MIPEHDEHGLLPPGIHACTLDEVRRRFCWTDRRTLLFNGLRKLINEWWLPQGIDGSVLIDGSFSRTKAEPEDIDAVFDLAPDAPFERVAICLVRTQTEHARLKSIYHVDVWARHPLIKNDLSLFFQYLGDKGAAELNLQRTHPKGILRISP